MARQIKQESIEKQIARVRRGITVLEKKGFVFYKQNFSHKATSENLRYLKTLTRKNILKVFGGYSKETGEIFEPHKIIFTPTKKNDKKTYYVTYIPLSKYKKPKKPTKDSVDLSIVEELISDIEDLQLDTLVKWSSITSSMKYKREAYQTELEFISWKEQSKSYLQDYEAMIKEQGYVTQKDIETIGELSNALQEFAYASTSEQVMECISDFNTLMRGLFEGYHSPKYEEGQLERASTPYERN